MSLMLAQPVASTVQELHTASRCHCPDQVPAYSAVLPAGCRDDSSYGTILIVSKTLRISGSLPAESLGSSAIAMITPPSYGTNSRA